MLLFWTQPLRPSAWAAFNQTGVDLVSTLAYHFAGSSINPSYITPNYTVVHTGKANPALPVTNGTSLDPLVIVKSAQTQFDLIRGSDFNASAQSDGGIYGIRVVPIDKVSRRSRYSERGRKHGALTLFFGIGRRFSPPRRPSARRSARTSSLRR